MEQIAKEIKAIEQNKREHAAKTNSEQERREKEKRHREIQEHIREQKLKVQMGKAKQQSELAQEQKQQHGYEKKAELEGQQAPVVTKVQPLPRSTITARHGCHFVHDCKKCQTLVDGRPDFKVKKLQLLILMDGG